MPTRWALVGLMTLAALGCSDSENGRYVPVQTDEVFVGVLDTRTGWMCKPRRSEDPAISVALDSLRFNREFREAFGIELRYDQDRLLNAGFSAAEVSAFGRKVLADSAGKRAQDLGIAWQARQPGTRERGVLCWELGTP